MREAAQRSRSWPRHMLPSAHREIQKCPVWLQQLGRASENYRYDYICNGLAHCCCSSLLTRLVFNGLGPTLNHVKLFCSSYYPLLLPLSYPKCVTTDSDVLETTKDLGLGTAQ